MKKLGKSKKIYNIFLEMTILLTIIKHRKEVYIMTKILDGPNGQYKDDGENLSFVDQRGNGSDKKLSIKSIANRLQPNGD